jgi:type II secretory ATPase GspE/PulE/Tfp pilus assembly ATPase PilB-like protein
MNPFVNPKKRSISLPKGCKDLVDVLRRRERKHEDAIRRFIRLVLLQAQQDRATELVIAPAGGGGTPIRYKVDGTWYEMSPFPSHIRSGVVTELERMAQLLEGPFPKEGIVGVAVAGTQLRWRVRITGADADCVLTPIEE